MRGRLSDLMLGVCLTLCGGLISLVAMSIAYPDDAAVRLPGALGVSARKGDVAIYNQGMSNRGFVVLGARWNMAPRAKEGRFDHGGFYFHWISDDHGFWWTATTPASYPLGALLLLPTIHLVQWDRRRRLAQAGICHKCGYDLRASNERCPECGTPVPAGGRSCDEPLPETKPV